MTERKLQVKRKEDFYYPIVFYRDFDSLAKEITDLGLGDRKCCIVTDSNVAPLYLDQVMAQLQKTAQLVTSYVLPAGEANKTLEQIQGIYEHLIKEHFDRKDLLLALGGGVVGDMTGYAAATYLRGIDFIQIPTTLLAQVDSSIGGKTGVDFLQYKNMVGAFHQPRLVYMNVHTLNTLSPELFSCGMGEVLKHGFIRDHAYSEWLSQNRDGILALDEELLSEMIYKSCVIKKTVVENDPTEQGERAVLNFGHTVGHAVEKLKNFTMLHGQCVAVGTVCAAFLSMKRGQISKEDYDWAFSLLKDFRLPVAVEGLDANTILSVTKSDKKMEHGQIKFILLEKPGYAYIDKTVSDQELLDAISSILI
ncbi:MAG: 3-dehydroquinate synthase [Blautia sp.]